MENYDPVILFCYSVQTFFCKKCKETIDFKNVSECKADNHALQFYKNTVILQYFHDKAVAKEIDHLSVSCPYDKCDWTGEYRHFQVSELP